MRIVAGKFRGKKLITPTTDLVRPTSDKARQAIFNMLQHGKVAREAEFSFHGAHILDGFCGTGAFGVEALSHGVAHVTFVDLARSSLKVAQQNVAAIKCQESAQFVHSAVAKISEADQAMDLIFLDPPYEQNLLEPAIAALLEKGWARSGTIWLLERHKKENLKLPQSLKLMDERDFGIARTAFAISI